MRKKILVAEFFALRAHNSTFNNEKFRHIVFVDTRDRERDREKCSFRVTSFKTRDDSIATVAA